MEGKTKQNCHDHLLVSFRVYADAIINHMAGVGREGTGIGGTYYHSTHEGPDFPGVPYDSVIFIRIDPTIKAQHIVFTEMWYSIISHGKQVVNSYCSNNLLNLVFEQYTKD